MQREPLRVAVTIGPDFRLGACFADERIVGWHGAVRPDTDDLAEVIGKVLCLVAIDEMLAQRDKEIVVRRLDDAAAEMIGGRERALLTENHAESIETGGCLIEH